MATLRNAWRLIAPSVRPIGWFWLAVVLALNLALTGLDVVLNYWTGAFWNALQQRDAAGFFRLLFLWRGAMPGWIAITLPYIALTVLDTWLVQRLQIGWRRWMTTEFLDRFLADRAYYRLSLTRDAASDAGADNPDQRIAEDLANFSSNTLVLFVDLFAKFTSLASFIALLWGLSSALRLFGIALPGLLVWAALLFALGGSVLTHLVGRRLIRLGFLRERVEANFRFSLMRLREHAEAVAMRRGEPAERARLDQRFGDIVANFLLLLRRRAILNSTVLLFTRAEGILPSLLAAPAWFAGRIAFGDITRIADAFAQVSGALSWFINTYWPLAAWAASVQRLSSFEAAIAVARQQTPIRHGTGGSVTATDLRLDLPNGATLMPTKDFGFAPGSATVLQGPNGAGKSTLLRAMAGLWPFGSGTITLPPGRTMFMPQRAYLPQGSLRGALCYPDIECDDADLARALEKVGLAAFAGRLDEIQDWGNILSGGEQQRICLASVLLQRPATLFLDEATSSLDGSSADALMAMLRAELPSATIISIGHRRPLASLGEQAMAIGQPVSTG